MPSGPQGKSQGADWTSDHCHCQGQGVYARCHGTSGRLRKVGGDITIRCALRHILAVLRKLANKAPSPQPWLEGSKSRFGEDWVQQPGKLTRKGPMELTANIVFADGFASSHPATSRNDFVTGGDMARLRSNIRTLLVGKSG